MKFRDQDNPQQYFQISGMPDCPRFTEEDIKQALLDVPEYLHKAKIYGDPSAASGAVFPFEWDEHIIDPFPVPSSWLHVCAMDLGWDDPTVAIWCAYNPDDGIYYIYSSYGKNHEVPAVHAQVIKSRGEWIPVILPHDAEKTNPADGQALMKAYKALLPNQVQSETFYNFLTADGKKNNRRRAGFDLLRPIMREGRLKIFSTVDRTLVQQLKNYRVINGKVQEHNDDYVDAMRYAVLSAERRGKPKTVVNTAWEDNQKYGWRI